MIATMYASTANCECDSLSSTATVCTCDACGSRTRNTSIYMLFAHSYGAVSIPPMPEVPYSNKGWWNNYWERDGREPSQGSLWRAAPPRPRRRHSPVKEYNNIRKAHVLRLRRRLGL